jgi:hypothetical protein
VVTLVGGGFAYRDVMDMTLVQMLTYAPLIEEQQVTEWRMQLAMHHNPYLTKEGAGRLWSALDRMAIGRTGPGTSGAPAGQRRGRGLDLKKLERVMGQVKKDFVSMDEYRRQSEARAQKRREAQEAMRKRGGLTADDLRERGR